MLALPFSVDETGAIRTTSDPKQQLLHRVFSVLATQLGDRVMRPNYGWNFNRFLFEPIDALDEKLMLQLAGDAITGWEPAAKLLGLTLSRVDESTVAVNLFYSDGQGTSSAVLSFGSDDIGNIFASVSVDGSANAGA